MGKNRRTRNGCIQCRKRRRKCDEARPICGGCQRKRTSCEWGLRLSFHASRALELSSDDKVTLEAFEARLPRSTSDGEDSLKVIDYTDIITALYTAPPRCSQPTLGFNDLGEDISAITDTEADDVETYNTQSYIDDFQVEPLRPAYRRNSEHEEAIAVDWQHEAGDSPLQQSSTDHFEALRFEPTLLTTPSSFFGVDIAPFFLGQNVSRNNSPTPEPEFAITSREKVELILLYLRDSATWCETTDSEMHFSVKSTHKLLESPAFAAAAMSLASRQRDTLQGCHQQRTLELYQYTIRLLLRHNVADADATILAVCTNLCVYEMMGSSVSEWRRHLGGCAGLLRMRKWNGSSEGIVKTCFWAFARIDVWAAYITNQTTLIPTASWVEDESIERAAAKENVDDYCNLVILIFAKIINTLNTNDKSSRHFADLRESVQSSWRDLRRWRRSRFPGTMPLLECGHTSKNPFPISIYTRSAGICGNTFYHSGCLLLLQTGYINSNSNVDEPDTMDPIWHAREIGGISVNNISHANWVNHLQPLYLAGCAFSGRRNSENVFSETLMTGNPHTALDDEDVFVLEKAAILRQFTRIERETGWSASARAKELRVLWGWEFT